MPSNHRQNVTLSSFEFPCRSTSKTLIFFRWFGCHRYHCQIILFLYILAPSPKCSGTLRLKMLTSKETHIYTTLKNFSLSKQITSRAKKRCWFELSSLAYFFPILRMPVYPTDVFVKYDSCPGLPTITQLENVCARHLSNI